MAIDRWLVVGGGVKGIIAAYFLNKAGYEVTIVEGAPFLGGVMHADEWSTFYLDKGCHLFDNVDDDITGVLMDLMDHQFKPVHVKYASRFNAELSEDIALPDLSKLDLDTEQLLLEIVNASLEKNVEAANYSEHLVERYGIQAAAHIEKAAEKMIQIDCSQISVVAAEILPFSRARMFDDKLTDFLKSHPVLDEKLAARPRGDAFRYYNNVSEKGFRNFYPSEQGTSGFIARAQKHLEKKGVEFRLKTSLSEISTVDSMASVSFSDGLTENYSRVFWTADVDKLAELVYGETPLKNLLHKVPMVLYYYVVPETLVKDWTYLTDFSDNTLLYRSSAPGIYGNQIDANGNTYICCEVPTKIGSGIWNEPETFIDPIWKECINLGQVDKGEYVDVHHIQTPVSFKIPKVGFLDTEDKIISRVQEHCEHIKVCRTTLFSKLSIVEYLRTVI
ncbi:MAG: NAD-binding protein [Pseudomonadales bacterium]